MTRLRILYITLFSLSAFWANGQSVDSLIAYADEQYAAGQYNLAAKEYQRALFFGPSESVGELTVKTGDCFLEQNLFREAEKYYHFASNIIQDDSLRFEALSKKSVCLIHQHSYQQAILDLFNANTEFSAWATRQKEFLLGTCFFGMGDFKEAETHFHLALKEGEIGKKETITTLLQSKKTYETRSPKSILDEYHYSRFGTNVFRRFQKWHQLCRSVFRVYGFIAEYDHHFWLGGCYIYRCALVAKILYRRLHEC